MRDGSTASSATAPPCSPPSPTTCALPITSLRLRAEFIEDEEVKAKVLETLAEMQAMTESVLAFARGDAEAEPTRPPNLTALVESVVEDMAESGRDIRFLPSPPLTLACRPRACAARSATSSTTHAYGIRATVAVQAAPGEARILVADEGPGIPPESLERVFDPFVRLEESRSRETGGAGLGLAIARGIFRAHGGDIRLQNRPEGGLLAVATLPLRA
jgi:signal transduction histidine kinase